MKNLLPVLFSAVIILTLCISGCTKDSLIVQSNSTQNTTAIANKPNSFSFAVDASLYYYSETHQLQINADTMNVAITISGHSTGTGSVVIKDSTDKIIYQKDLGSNAVSADIIKISDIPKILDITLSNYTGKIALAVTGN